MKKVLSCVFSMTLLFVSVSLFAQKEEKTKERYEHFKERNISKSYPASGNTLFIENSFGAVKVITWAGNEIKVDIHIEASSTNAAHADKLFARLDVKDWKESNSVHFKTSTGDDKKKKDDDNCKDCKSNMTIDYEIHIPSGNAMNIENSFGSIEIPDYNGKLDVSCKFGSLNAGALANAGKVEVEFGKGTIKSLGNADMNFKFSSVQIGSLSGANKANMEFCGASKIGLSSGLTSLNMKQSYGTIALKPLDNLSASYDISTSFGSVKDRANVGLVADKDDDGFDSDKRYTGKSGSGAAKVDVKSSFGKVVIGEPTTEDNEDKKKDKDKDKDKSKHKTDNI